MSRRRIGATGVLVLSVVGLLIGIITIRTMVTRWVVVILLAIVLIGAVMAMFAPTDEPRAREVQAEHRAPNQQARPRSALIKGDVRRSSVTGVYTQADALVDGSVKDSTINDIWHAPREHEES